MPSGAPTPPPKPKRLSLVERQAKQLRESGFSSGKNNNNDDPSEPRRRKASASGPTFRPSKGFKKRQDEALERMGMSNASTLSRKAEEVVFSDRDEGVGSGEEQSDEPRTGIGS